MLIGITVALLVFAFVLAVLVFIIIRADRINSPDNYNPGAAGSKVSPTAAQLTPQPTAVAVVTPTPAPTLAPVVTPTPVPTLAPVVTPTPSPAPVYNRQIGANLYVNGSASGAEVAVATINASSVLYEQGYNHEAAQTNDHNLSTDWSEGSYGSGVGEWLQYNFSSATQLDSFMIYPGYWKSSALFKQNNRPSSLTISFSDGGECYVTLSDEQQPQLVVLSEAVNVTWVRFTITGVYSGSLYNDCCISEINVYNSKQTGGVVPTVTLSAESFPTSISQGSSFDLAGTVSTNAGILTDVSCSILSGGTILQSRSAAPNASVFKIGSSVINDQLRFGILAAGSYTIRLTATASNNGSYNTVTLLERSFTVASAPAALAAPVDYVYGSTAPFWGIFCNASKEYDVIVKNANTLKAYGFDVRIIITTDWENLNSEAWYSVTCGTYASRADAEAMFNQVQAVYPSAFIKYTGSRK